jgi:hypothetical protein
MKSMRKLTTVNAFALAWLKNSKSPVCSETQEHDECCSLHLDWDLNTNQRLQLWDHICGLDQSMLAMWLCPWHHAPHLPVAVPNPQAQADTTLIPNYRDSQYRFERTEPSTEIWNPQLDTSDLRLTRWSNARNVELALMWPRTERGRIAHPVGSPWSAYRYISSFTNWGKHLGNTVFEPGKDGSHYKGSGSGSGDKEEEKKSDKKGEQTDDTKRNKWSEEMVQWALSYGFFDSLE